MKKKAVIMLIVLAAFMIPAGWLNARQGVVLYGVNYVEEDRTDDSWRYEAAQGGAEMIWSGGEGNGWIEYKGVRHEAQLEWNGDKARIEFDDGEVIEGYWRGGELVDETGLPLWLGDSTVIVIATDDEDESEIGKISLARVLCEMDRRENEPLGSLVMVLLGAVVYVFGMFGVLYPEEMHFIGKRWQYDYVELSDMGRTAQVVGGYTAMAAGVVFMYLPCFV